MCALLI
ncbi:hypothetical protein F383_23184 [Gossypium arboreum]|nr:hypothetical protein F383_23184 [Gossypium arboreum]